MGAAETDLEASADEKPQHRVYLDTFGMDRTEVTNAMFAKCVAAGACHERRYSPYLWGVASRTHPDYFGNPAYASYPVIMLDGDEAAAYCRWAGRRLPTEAEWEKAARGTDARPYPWGTAEPDCRRANFFGCAQDTVEVAALPDGASPYGALNMAGNVWEWTADWYAAGYYRQSPERNPSGPAAGQEHTLRGGGLTALKNNLRVTTRVGGVYHWADGEAGFRCASSAAAP
jgi:eukaryotic-like serine/threonine-protein kinase